jgi:hypothetical protein
MSAVTHEGMTLRYNTGAAVLHGDSVKDSHGVEWTVVGGRSPYSPGTSGRVWVRESSRAGDHMREFFPNVFGMTWSGQ